MSHINLLILNGPNLNLLGLREPKIYGSINLNDIIKKISKYANKYNCEITHLQSNSERILIESIHQSEKYDYIIINPAALTHTSIALRDALLSINTPFIEVHISNIYSRENFRHHSYISDISSGMITGLGIYGYFCAVKTAINRINKKSL